MDETGIKKTYAVDVDGHPVPTWECVSEIGNQVRAQGCRVDRLGTVAWIALGIAVASIVLNVVQIIG